MEHPKDSEPAASEQHLDSQTTQLLEYFKALADPTRLRLVNILKNHELNVNELVQLFKMGQSRISRHLKILTSAGLLSARRDGLWMFYSSPRHGLARDFINAIQFFMNNNQSLSADLTSVAILLSERGIATKNFFNNIAGDWDRLNKEILGNFNLIETVIDRMPICQCAVDLGCGTGQLLLAMQAKSKLLIGVDDSAKMLELAKRQFALNLDSVSIRIGNVEHLPLRDAEADFVTVNMVLHHLSNPVESLNEINRVLAVKGRLLITDFARHNQEEMRRSYGDRWLGIDFHKLEKKLASLGFVIIENSSFAIEKGLNLQLILSEKQA